MIRTRNELSMKKSITKTRSAYSYRKESLKKNELEKLIFGPIFKMVAQNALAVTGIKHGICLDIGSRHGLLALAIAREAPAMQVVSFDYSFDFRAVAINNIKKSRMAKRIRLVEGDVHAMPFENWYADLIVSRGSLFLWKNRLAAFSEILRVLKPGGAAYIGGGAGDPKLRDQAIANILIQDPSWEFSMRRKTSPEELADIKEIFEILGCASYQIIDDVTGFWIIIRKQV